MKILKKLETLETVERERERVEFSKINTKWNGRKRLYKKQENKTRIGYLEKVQKGKKGMKLLHDSLSFL